MADDIIQFSPGGKVTAEETNENNLLLKEWALDNSQSEAYIDGKIATLTTNLNSQISSINTQIGNCVKTSGNQTVAGKKYFTAYADDNTPITTVKISKGKNGYLKMGNGLIIQWMNVDKAASNGIVTKTWPTAFSNTNYVISRNINYNTTSTSSVPDREFAVYKKSASQFSYYAYDTFAEMFIAVGY